MGFRVGLICLAIGLTAAAALPVQAEFQVPKLRGPVNDEANMLSRQASSRIAVALDELQLRGGTQLAVLTVPNLDGSTIEQASIRVTDAWKLGDEKLDNGVLLMIARDERRIRIEVGQGLEGDLTDAHAKRIVDEAMTPLFRAGDVDGGVAVGVFEIANRTNPDVDLRPQLEGAVRASSRRSNPRDSEGMGLFPLLFFALFIFMRSGFFGGSRRRGRYLWGPAMMGGGVGMGRGASFGGGGFGGFSGGGGGFSGGGASGGW